MESPKGYQDNRAGRGSGSSKMRGLPHDTPEVRLSKTLSYILRHGAQKEGLMMREDGYMKVSDLIDNPRVKSQNTTLESLQTLVKADAKQRYSLISENDESAGEMWWIKANQGHSLKEVKLVLKPIFSISDIPSGIAVHGTTRAAWKIISSQGLSKMKRNHVHLAQGVAGNNIVSGMRKTSDVLIYIDVTKAIDADIKFFLSDNGVVLTEGDEQGFLAPQFFLKVEMR